MTCKFCDNPVEKPKICCIDCSFSKFEKIDAILCNKYEGRCKKIPKELPDRQCKNCENKFKSIVIDRKFCKDCLKIKDKVVEKKPRRTSRELDYFAIDPIRIRNNVFRG